MAVDALCGDFTLISPTIIPNKLELDFTNENRISPTNFKQRTLDVTHVARLVLGHQGFS